ncbi:MAG TPA: phage holin family protein [Gemmatimonadaceae bacterium]|nr:phage holin family protein [Gemmatimonadaceae bacterium]
MANREIQVDPNATVLDLISRLGDDGKRLLGDEVRLAKLEVNESVHTAGRGMIWLGVSLALAFVALTALTVGLSALIGRVLTDALWLGTLVTGVLWVAMGGLLVKSGISMVKTKSLTLPETRRELVLTRDALTHGNGR